MKNIYLLCGISKQAHHGQMKRALSEQEKEMIYLRLMEQTRTIHPGMGLRTMYEMLEPEGIGRDGFIALGLREGFRLIALDKQVRTTYSVKAHRYTNLLAGMKFTSINQLWTSDITFIFCLEKFYYLVLIMDVYSRRIIGYSIADNMRAERNHEALKMALLNRGIQHYHEQLIHHSDMGSQYASDIYTDTLSNYGIRISMCEDVYENTHIERVNDTIKNQYLNRMSITSERELKRRVTQVIYTYNEKRPHQSLNKMTPFQYEQYLTTIPKDKRKTMEIYTVKKDMENNNPNQLKLVLN
jgi:transposase InsO family protein